MKKEMKISHLFKITLIISIVAILIGCACGYFVLDLSKQQSASSQKQLEAQTYSAQMKAASDFLTNQMRLYSVSGKKEYYDAYMNELDNTKRRESALEHLNALGLTQEELGYMAKSKEHSDALVPLEVSAAELAAAGSLGNARAQMFGDAYLKDKQGVDDNIALFDQNLTARLAAESKDVSFRLHFMICCLCAMLAVLLVINIITYQVNHRRVVRPVAALEESCKQIAGGNLGYKIPLRETTSEVGQLTCSLKRMQSMLGGYISDISEHLGSMAQGKMSVVVEREYVGDFQAIKAAIEQISSSLCETLARIREVAEQVSGSSTTVSDGARVLSEGASEQASEIDELTATIEEISERVRGNAVTSAKVSDTAREVGGALETSNQHMKRMTEAMHEIDLKSSEIGKIIKTIEDIAFQTNILALNAAVEAARAGAAGKGFAVVADEVRNLAGKSAEAARNTTELIEGSIDAVQNGNRIAGETAESLLSAVQSAKAITGSIEAISRASAEQSESVNQVTRGIEQISRVVQANSATAEESAAASEELSGQAQLLRTLVGQFTLSGSESGQSYAITR